MNGVGNGRRRSAVGSAATSRGRLSVAAGLARRSFLLALLMLLAWTHAEAARPEFFVFDNGVGRGSWTPTQQAQTLKELGYDGISYNYTTPEDLAAWQKAFGAAFRADGWPLVQIIEPRLAGWTYLLGSELVLGHGALLKRVDYGW